MASSARTGNGRYREGLSQRLGRVPAAFTRQLAGKHVIWLHAVSVGELLAAAPLITQLQSTLGPDWQIAISTTTATGQKLARERFPQHLVFYFPLDLASTVRPWLRALNPRLLILVESELWPRLLHECATRQIPVVVVNARISDRSFRRTKPFARLWLQMANNVTLFLPQGPETSTRLRVLGVDPRRIGNSGNLKFDMPQPVESAKIRQLRNLVGNHKLLVAGSTLAGEEAIILHAWDEIKMARANKHPTLLLIAPRHPDRFALVESLIANHASHHVKVTSDTFATAQLTHGDIILLDTLGDLAAIYSLASVAIVGGSFVPMGGHNPLEPARFAVPTVMGSSYQNFRDIVHILRGLQAIHISTPETLATDVTRLLQNDQGLGTRAQKAYQSQSGATARTLTVLLKLL